MQQLRVPGLLYFPNFISLSEHDALVAFWSVQYRSIVASTSKMVVGKAVVHTPRGSQSTSTRTFVNCKVSDPSDGCVRQCEFFESYGDWGHSLCYFRGNANIPRYCEPLVNSLHEKVLPVAAFQPERKEVQWNATLNVYKVCLSQFELPGFPFHVDVHTNGTITMILSLIEGATIEFVQKTDDANCCSFALAPSSLLVLSGESRYNWGHRVLPSKVDVMPPGQIGRMSLVFGCQ